MKQKKIIEYKKNIERIFCIAKTFHLFVFHLQLIPD